MSRPSRESGKDDSIYQIFLRMNQILCYICLVVNRISVFVEKP
jgi:hypothetical protein